MEPPCFSNHIWFSEFFVGCFGLGIVHNYIKTYTIKVNTVLKLTLGFLLSLFWGWTSKPPFFVIFFNSLFINTMETWWPIDRWSIRHGLCFVVSIFVFSILYYCIIVYTASALIAKIPKLAAANAYLIFWLYFNVLQQKNTNFFVLLF